MDVSIIIVNYKSAKLICECVESIVQKTSGIEYEIIIVDNDPADDFNSVFDAKNYNASIKYVRMPENLGFGMANNEGFRYAGGKYYFCLNPDTLLVNNAIKILFDYMESHSKCGACGGNLYNKEMHRAISFRRILPGAFWEFSEGVKRHPEHLLYGRNSRFNHTTHPIKVGYITGADLMLRSDLIKNIGAFAPEFFMYYEETDLCCRIHKAGYDVVSVPEAKIIHLEGMSSGSDMANVVKLKNYAESRLKYYKRNVSLRQTVRAYKYHLKNLQKQYHKEGYGRNVPTIHLEQTIKALDAYPELKKLLPERLILLNQDARKES